MDSRAIVGLVRSRIAYLKEWPECVTVDPDGTGSAAPERVFDLSEILRPERANDEVESDYGVAGRHLPFPIFAVVGSGHGVIIISGDEAGFYAYCYTADPSMLLVQFTPTGWTYEGFNRHDGVGAPESLPKGDPHVERFAEGVAMLLTLVDRACEDTRHVVSYRLNRAERRSATKELGGNLDATLVHHVCLNLKSREKVTTARGDTVVPTPKRLHEVRSHWRHLKSGAVVRVRAHRRGQRGGELRPRIYTVNATEQEDSAIAVDFSRSTPAVDSALTPPMASVARPPQETNQP